MSKKIQGIIALLAVVALTVGCEELRLDNGLLSTTGNAFQCSSNEDCVEPFECEIKAGEAIGVCAVEQPGDNCAKYDKDGDQYLTADEPIPDSCQGKRGDCDDNDPLTNPGAVEICDGNDNNCDGRIDEDIDPIPCARQLGVCGEVNDGEGAFAECVDGSFENCADTGKYGPDFEEIETSCDGLDNDCDGRVDEQCCNVDQAFVSGGGACGFGNICNERTCVCSPGDAFACSVNTGTCTRGVRVCETSTVAMEQPCMAVELEAPSSLVACDSVSDCSDGQVCVAEFIRPDESFEDSCVQTGDAGCQQRVCRTIATTGETCSADADCSGSGEVCYAGECRPAAIESTAEVCNGLDDNCDGSIDNNAEIPAGTVECGSCAFNMVRNPQIVDLGGGGGSGTLRPTCFDRYEASRPDATATDAGSNELYAVSRAGVMPWTGVNRAQAAAACAGDAYNANFNTTRVTPKQLCQYYVWPQFCGGVPNSANVSRYVYGDAFDSDVCVDGRDGTDSPQPSGSRLECKRANADSRAKSHFDTTGNVWEWVVQPPFGGSAASGNRSDWLLGGSYAWPEATAGSEGLVKEDSMVCKPDFQGLQSTNLIPCSSDSQCTTQAGSTCVDGRCRQSCSDDSGCSPFFRCESADDTSGTFCYQFLEKLPDAETGDWSDYDNVGFRCCMIPR